MGLFTPHVAVVVVVMGRCVVWEEGGFAQYSSVWVSTMVGMKSFAVST